jgi:nicotinate-nucleotide adenylyltransferase
MKTGLMGGTFNPVHYAHLRIAEEAFDMCGLDRIMFIPAADPPHKPLAGNVSYFHRSEMVKLAIAGNRNFEYSDIEGRRPGKSFSIDTIAALQKINPDDRFFFIIGSDSFLEIGQWHRYDEIFKCCSLIVLERPGRHVSSPLESLPAAVRGEFGFDVCRNRLEHLSGNTVQFLAGYPMDISSSEIRRLAGAGRSVNYLVPPEVVAYIKQQRIYNECP